MLQAQKQAEEDGDSSLAEEFRAEADEASMQLDDIRKESLRIRALT